MKFARFGVLALSALLGFVPAARAGVYYFVATQGLWRIAGNWRDSNGTTPLVPPGANDRAIFGDLQGNSYICEVDDVRTVDTISVRAGAELQIDPGVSLTLENDNHNGQILAPSPDNSNVDGVVTLLGGALPNPPGGGLVFTNADHVISGTAKIVLQKLGSIQIAYGLTVTNRLATAGQGIRGQGGIVEDFGGDDLQRGRFRNEGLCAADGTDLPALNFRSHLALTDIASAKWNLEADGAYMKFDRSATLAGSFNGQCGAYFWMDGAAIWTCGTFTRNGGGVDLTGAGPEFRYASYVMEAGRRAATLPITGPFPAISCAGSTCT